MKKIFIYILFLALLLTTSYVSANIISVKYNSGITCTPDGLYCSLDGKSIERCNSEGDDKILVKNCVKGCEFHGSSNICAEDYVKKDYTSQIIIALAIIIGFVILALILKNKNKKESS
ncbi:MAG: hypothetical protein AABW80_05425 [Nanoarchaeota archaeon]